MHNPLESLPGYSLRRASSRMASELASRLAVLDLRMAEASLLVLIGANPSIKQSELCQVLDIQRANMTPLVARLETRDLVVRKAVDGRSYGLELTPTGTSLSIAALEAMHTHETWLNARVPPAYRQHFLCSLNALWKSEA